jgi:hypothetical protein
MNAIQCTIIEPLMKNIVPANYTFMKTENNRIAKHAFTSDLVTDRLFQLCCIKISECIQQQVT